MKVKENDKGFKVIEMTVEEKAGEYAEKIEAEYGFDIHPKTASFQGFIDGYSEAMRWRDPEKELPKEDGLYLCKCKSNRLGFYFEIVFFNKVWRSNNVIGWRPIE